MAGVGLTRGSCRPTSWVCRPAPRLVDWPGCSAAACPGRGHTVACAGDAFPSRGPALGPSAQPSAPAASRAWSLGCGSRWDLGSACPGRPDSARVSRAGLPSDLRLSLRGQEQFQRNPDSYNGAVRENYVWSQDYTDLELKVPVPGHVVKGRQVTRGPLAAHSSLGRGCRPGHRPQGCFSAVPPHPAPPPAPCRAGPHFYLERFRAFSCRAWPSATRDYTLEGRAAVRRAAGAPQRARHGDPSLASSRSRIPATRSRPEWGSPAPGASLRGTDL